MDELEKIAHAQYATMQSADEVEVHLVFVHTLHEPLNLLGIKPPMLYESGVDELGFFKHSRTSRRSWPKTSCHSLLPGALG